MRIQFILLFTVYLLFASCQKKKLPGSLTLETQIEHHHNEDNHDPSTILNQESCHYQFRFTGSTSEKLYFIFNEKLYYSPVITEKDTTWEAVYSESSYQFDPRFVHFELKHFMSASNTTAENMNKPWLKFIFTDAKNPQDGMLASFLFETQFDSGNLSTSAFYHSPDLSLPLELLSEAYAVSEKILINIREIQ